MLAAFILDVYTDNYEKNGSFTIMALSIFIILRSQRDWPKPA